MTLIVERSETLAITSPNGSENGSGNTELFNQISSMQDPDCRICVIDVNANTTIDSLSHDIIQQTSITKTNELYPIVGQVHQYLEYAAQNNFLPVIIINDAHKLSVEVLKFVLQLAELRYAESSFRILLFCTEAINNLLDDPGLKDLTTVVLRNIHINKVEPIKPKKEIKQQAGNQQPSVKIAEKDLLSDKQDEIRTESNASTSRFGKLFMALVSISLISIIVYFAVLKEETSIIDPVITLQPQEAITEMGEIQFDQVIPKVEIEDEEAIFQETDNTSEPEVISENDLIPDTQTTEIESEQLAEEDYQDTTTDLPTYEPENELDETSIELTDLEQAIEVEIHEENIPLAESDEFVETDSTVVEAVATEIVSEEENNAFNLEVIPDYLSRVKGPDWLRQQTGSAYVLQLISAQYISNLNDLLRGLPDLQDELSGYVRYTPSGKSRYLLLYGIYSDREAARIAIQDLPDKLKSIPPWPRTIKDVRKDLDAISVNN